MEAVTLRQLRQRVARKACGMETLRDAIRVRLERVANAALPLRQEPPNGKASRLRRWTHRNALAPLQNRSFVFCLVHVL
ncbi:MAG: hypothetical protein V7K48_27270 [Nostoc sp.]|uniref:hypothetical protein n=1 Tax=Nostoc sp. TaxID=1180 RepID=UPI002FF45E01